MKTGSIRISKGGSRIHLTGQFANDFFKEAQVDYEQKQKLLELKRCQCGEVLTGESTLCGACALNRLSQ